MQHWGLGKIMARNTKSAPCLEDNHCRIPIAFYPLVVAVGRHQASRPARATISALNIF